MRSAQIQRATPTLVQESQVTRYTSSLHNNIMYIYRVLINALSADIIHINLNIIFYAHVEHSPIKNDLRKVLYGNTHTRTHSHTHSRTQARTHARTHTHSHSHTHTHTPCRPVSTTLCRNRRGQLQ